MVGGGKKWKDPRSGHKKKPSTWWASRRCGKSHVSGEVASVTALERK